MTHTYKSLSPNLSEAGAEDTHAGADMVRMRAYRLGRLRAQLSAKDLAGCVLFDPINIRYACGSRNMAVWTLHNPARYVFVPTEGPVVLFDFHSTGHLSAGLETIQEVRPACSWFYFSAGPHLRERARRWAAEIADLVSAYGGGNRRVAVDRCDSAGVEALVHQGIELFDAQEPCEAARCIKSGDEIYCMNEAISVAETGMAKMREALEPGITENELWSILHQTNIAMGGEWIETRLLTSGERTNPWFQVSSDRSIEAGDLVSFDTDLIGPHGYCADISRTYFCGSGTPSAEQKSLYGLAHVQIHANMDLLKPGLSFQELAELAWKTPDAYLPNRYVAIAHGVGLRDEYPHCAYADEIQDSGYDGHFEAGMTICLESYIGKEGGKEGVKLEQQVLITENGTQLLSTFPFEHQLMV